MKVYYSSMFINKEINNIDELARLTDIEKVQLCLDTNICVYLRDLYNNPIAVFNKKDNTFNELYKFLKDVDYYDLEVDFLYGCEEASRTLDIFKINTLKLEEICKNINSLFNMDITEVLQFVYSNKNRIPHVDNTERTESKIESLERRSSFKNLLTLNYASLLQLYIQRNKYPNMDNAQQMIRFIDFLNEEIDMMNVSSILFGYHYFSNNSTIKKMIHTKNKDIEYKLHAIWNASIDLTLPVLVSHKFIEKKSSSNICYCRQQITHYI